MNKRIRKSIIWSICITISLGNTVFASQSDKSEQEIYPNATRIELMNDTGTVDGENFEEYDYTWNCDPSQVHDEVDGAPAEYYTGTKPDTNAAVYVDHELYYFPLLDENAFKLIRYDGEEEWAYYYMDGVNNSYIFSTLPNLGQQLPEYMMHSAAEAAENKVLHITKPGEYILSGEWNGQIYVDCGEDAYDNDTAKVTLILNGVNINCSVAPGIIFKNVYECDNDWENNERKDAIIDTTDAGATIILADDSENLIKGNNVFRMLKSKYKDENSVDEIKLQKKMRKMDGALYSYMTMNIDGEEKKNGLLYVESSFEGIDSELHLNVKGGNVTINSQDDGMNVNEDHVSVIAFSGGEVTINAALGAEGDGIDSNGYIWINGGNISVNGVRIPDSALDSDDGVYYQAGKVIVDGIEQEYEENSVIREAGPGGFMGGPRPEDGEMPMPDAGRIDERGGPGRGMPSPSDFDIKTFKKEVAELSDDATFEDVLSLLWERELTS